MSQYQKLSEKFIEKFQDKINWMWISIKQKLSEEFIEKYKDKVDWYEISRYQKLSEELVIKFKQHIDIDYLLKENMITQDFYNDLIRPVYLSRFQLLDI